MTEETDLKIKISFAYRTSWVFGEKEISVILLRYKLRREAGLEQILGVLRMKYV